MTEIEVRPAGSCRHRPISNGWSAGTDCPPFSYCGYCKAYIEHDAEWTAKFSTPPPAARILATVEPVAGIDLDLGDRS